MLLLCAGLGPAARLWSAEWQSQHALDTSFLTGRWEFIAHTRLRTRPIREGVLQVRLGPIVEYSYPNGFTWIGGYYFSRDHNGVRWFTTHRPFAGFETTLKMGRAKFDVRALAERFQQPENPYARYRQRVRWKASNGIYAGVETFLDAHGWRGVRYSSGYQKKGKSVTVDFGYFYERREHRAGADRHMVLTTVHFKRKGRWLDPDFVIQQ